MQGFYIIKIGLLVLIKKKVDNREIKDKILKNKMKIL
jgi:hypothetical protein